MFDVIKRCINTNLNDYENINFDLEINKVIIGSAIVLMIGIIIFSIRRANIRRIVMQLIRYGAFSQDDAKTVKELGFDKSTVIKTLLSGDNQLTRVVSRIGEKEYNYDEYIKLDKKQREALDVIDFENERFYIKPEKKDRARNIVDRYITSIPRVVAVCVFVLIIAFCFVTCMPGILETINNMLETTKM